MKNKLTIWIISLLAFLISGVYAQVSDTATSKLWEHKISTYIYFLNNETIFIPVYEADKKKLHLEARYNYENTNAFSAWGGYNFSGGKKLRYTITPMAGLVIGSTEGIGTGLNIELEFKKFSISSNSEYIFDLNSQDNNFYYNWTDITYSFNKNIWSGISIQRTKLYKTNLDIQRGFMAGGRYRKFELSAYLLNIFFDTPFFSLTASYDF